MFKVPEHYRITKPGRLFSDSSYGNNGAFKVTGLFVIASEGDGWEHVSVSLPNNKRCPSWGEMCKIKDLFWDDEDCVIQFHPPKSEYVNVHKSCLHLWREQNIIYNTPPKYMIG